jgi:hypothetical protein
MATIAGSQFTATGPGLPPEPVNIVFVPPTAAPPLAGDFNLEIFVGAPAVAPVPASGYGLAVLSPSGLRLDLISGGFAVTDNGAGSDTLDAHGVHETIAGGSADVTLILDGDHEVASGGNGLNLITVNGTADTVFGGHDDLVNVYGAGNVIYGGSDADTIDVYSAGDTINGGAGPAHINLFSAGDVVNTGSGPDTIIGSGDTINGGAASDTVSVVGFNDLVNLGPGGDTLDAAGFNDTVAAGTVNAGGVEHDLVTFTGGNMTFGDGGGPQLYADTVVGFVQGSDTIHLTGSDAGSANVTATVTTQQSQNSGQDTLLTLHDGSTILLKGIGHVDSNFFS